MTENPDVIEERIEVFDLSNPEAECEILPNFPTTIVRGVGSNINDRPIVCGGSFYAKQHHEEYWNDKCFILGQDEPIVQLNSFRFLSAGISITNDVFWITGKISMYCKICNWKCYLELKHNLNESMDVNFRSL